MANQSHPHKRALGPWMLTALVAGNMVGSGIYYLPTELASFGSISLLAWVFTACGALSLALVFAKLSMVMPKIGGPYAYSREAFGDFVGFQMAYNYWIALWIGNSAIAVAFTGYLGVFFPILHTNHLYAFFVSAGALWAVTLINIIGVRWAGITQLITTILKFTPLILVSFVGLFCMHPQMLPHFNTTGQSNLAALSGAATLTFWAFVGLESATVPAEDVINPKRNIPRATIIGTLIAAAIYIIGTLAVMGQISSEQLAHSNAPFADAARILFGPVGASLIAIGAIVSCFGALNGWTLLQAQIPLAAARDKLFPQFFAKETSSGTPVNGLVFTSILITGLLLLTLDQGLIKQFKFITLLATLAGLIPYFFTTMAELMIFIKEPEMFKGEKLWPSVIIAIVAGTYAFWIIIGAGQNIVFYGSLLFFSSIPVYIWMKYRETL
jgi:APA family basic amino acid/polyamine antiporter